MSHSQCKLICVITLLFCCGAFAKQTENLTVSVMVPPVQVLKIVNTKDFPPISIADYKNGFYNIPQAVTLQISSNVDWQVVMYSIHSNLYLTQGIFKPVSDFSVGLQDGPFHQMSVAPQVIFTGKAGIKDMTFFLNYRMKIDNKSTPAGDWYFDPVIRLEPRH